MKVPTWTTAQTKMSVLVNGSYLPFKKTPDLMQRFVRPALFSTGFEGFEIRVFGTALMATYRGWDFALTTSHQVDEKRGAPSAKSFVVIQERDGKRIAISPSSLYLPHVQEGQFPWLSDLVFFDYSRLSDRNRFPHLDLSNIVWSDGDGFMVDYSFVIGYPTESHQIDFDPIDEEQLAKFTLRWIRQDLQRSERALLDTESRDIFVKHAQSSRRSVDPDGLSGSPVFSIVSDARKDRHLRFEGIITDAKNDRFAVLPSAEIRPFLDAMAGPS